MQNKKKPDRSKEFESLLYLFKTKDNFILTTHRGPDPDGIGAELGLDLLLEKLGKRHFILNADRIPDKLSFLDPKSRIRNLQEAKLQNIQTDYTVVIVDNSEIDRIGDVSNYLKPDRSNLIIIDHHDNVDHIPGMFSFPEYSASSEIVYELMLHAGIEPDYNTAIALYLGIVVDTGQFKYNKTSPRTYELAGKLVDYGFPTEETIRKIYEDVSADILYLKRDIFSTLELYKDYGLACIDVRRETYQKYGFNSNPIEGMVSELLNPRDVHVSLCLSDGDDGLVKMSFRSKGSYNVCNVAKLFGGGGHNNASGAAVKGDFKTVKSNVILKLKEMIRNTKEQA